MHYRIFLNKQPGSLFQTGTYQNVEQRETTWKDL